MNVYIELLEFLELSSEYAFVFGNNMLINEIVNTSVDAYKKGRVKKVII